MLPTFARIAWSSTSSEKVLPTFTRAFSSAASSEQVLLKPTVSLAQGLLEGVYVRVCVCGSVYSLS